MSSRSARPFYGFAGAALMLAIGLMVPGGQAQKAAVPDGPAIFAKKCAGCHGDKGQGGPGFNKPLIGTQSVDQLASFINQSMPPGGKKTPAPEAKKIAAYMYEAFYSPIAQERNRPARVELARLTVKQYKNAVTDLVNWSPPAVPKDNRAGLKGEYFKGRGTEAKNRVFERVDPEINFDFGPDSPAKEGFDPYNYTIMWQGSVFAPDTGDYEFVVQSDHAVRMWVNNWGAPLIDGWVRANTDKEFRGAISLMGGRSYFVRLEFSKATQGVDDKKKPDKPPAKAAVRLLWKQPKRALEVVPARNLFPELTAPLFVVQAPFPADDRSIGYERGTSVSKEWSDATTAGALEAADFISRDLAGRAGIPDNASDRKEKARSYCQNFVLRAFRRPLSKELEATYIDKQLDSAPNLEAGVKRVIILALKSPRFLYREIEPNPDAFSRASDLSFGLWDTIPDNELWSAAWEGRLANPEMVGKQAERMVSNPRAWNKLRDFLLFWLKVDEVPEIVKNAKRYPEFNDEVVSDLRSSLELGLKDAAWGEKSDFRELMLGDKVFLNGKLAKLYGAPLPADAPFQAVALDGRLRSGVLTHPYLLARFAYLENSSPIHRGVLVARSLLGRTLQPPPAAFTPLAPSLHPDLTTRQRVALQTKPDGCNSCHSMINPLGFTLERFDAIGRLRSSENGKAIDSTGSYKSRSGAVVKFTGAVDLAKFIAGSDESHSAFIEKLFHHLVKQPTLAYGPTTVPTLRESFEKNGYDIRKLMVDIMAKTAR